ncbi:MAG: 2-amino-4-hydroxy-6-hydroxymethyldihydropteridine diphosphokinase [Candidatus Aminicenantes bacterium]|nr:2-amino-4-hydroxy-6-hydroxymethyldihydropteridine diphosphokinase [Candidatus Aminicenantes bacterium]
MLSLGSNLGRREDYLARALNRLDERGVEPVLCSSVYETEPVGVVDQGLFLNLVCQVETRQAPASLLATCMEVESSLGRSRNIAKGPRNIDIDILFFGREIVRRRDLQIPHPRFRNRRFVLVPLNEILPCFKDPITGRRPDELLRLCPDRTRVTRYCAAARRPAPPYWKIG